jgi:hypothetical protein
LKKESTSDRDILLQETISSAYDLEFPKQSMFVIPD